MSKEEAMRYFSYDEPDSKHPGTSVVTFSEDEIRKQYYPFWYERMCRKFGKETVDERYSFEECLQDWITIHWAWQVPVEDGDEGKQETQP